MANRRQAREGPVRPKVQAGEVMRILFVGEERSPTAIERGWTWESGRLAAKQLFDALSACDIDPARCRFANWFERGGPSAVRRHRGPVVAMGQKVQKAMAAAGIEYIPIVHPAARGHIRAKARYAAHIAEALAQVSGRERR